MYRPQFPYKVTPPGYDDEPFDYYFDQNSVPALGEALVSGHQISDVPLRLSPDADFYWRGIKIIPLNANTNFYIRFKDGFGNLLSEYIPAYNYVSSPTPFQPPLGGNPMVLESEIYCPAGTIVYVEIAVP